MDESFFPLRPGEAVLRVARTHHGAGVLIVTPHIVPQPTRAGFVLIELDRFKITEEGWTPRGAVLPQWKRVPALRGFSVFLVRDGEKARALFPLKDVHSFREPGPPSRSDPPSRSFEPYFRVAPRDLFNEASLLKCLGALWIKLDERRGHDAYLKEDGNSPWDIGQDPSDGSVSVRNLTFMVGGERCTLYRPLNSRQSWPLLMETANPDFEAIPVFDEHGGLSDVFIEFIRSAHHGE